MGQEQQEQERGYKVVGLTYYHNTLALVVESEETEQVQQTSTSDQKPEKTSPTISEPTRNRFWLAAEVSQAYRFAQAADVRQAMAFFVLLLIDPFAYRSPRWRWLVEGYSYNLSSGETREGWNPLLARIKEITGEKPTLQSLVENPRLEEAFCLVAGMGLGQAEQAVALTGLVNEKTLKGLPTAYLNRVLEENGLQAANPVWGQPGRGTAPALKTRGLPFTNPAIRAQQWLLIGQKPQRAAEPPRLFW